MAKITFGPGSLESLQLHVFKARGSSGARFKAHLSGTYQAACPAVGFDTVTISERFDDWTSASKDRSEPVMLAAAAVAGEADAAAELAQVMLDWALEGYSCGHGD